MQFVTWMQLTLWGVFKCIKSALKVLSKFIKQKWYNCPHIIIKNKNLKKNYDWKQKQNWFTV